MLFRWWNKRHAHANHRPQRRQTGRLTFRPTVESLEERTLLNAGSLDPTFGVGGEVVTAFGTSTASSNGVVIQPDGKLIAVGSSGSDFAVARYNPNGTLDTSFGTGGKVTTSFGASSVAQAVALESNGDIVVVGTSGDNFALAVYNPNGSLDTSFGSGGLVTSNFALLGLGGDSANAVAIQSNGDIVVAGTAADLLGLLGSDFAVARYTSTGALDTSFGSGGVVTTSFGLLQTDGADAVALQSNGDIVAAGHTSTGSSSNFALAIYASNGSLDNTATTNFGSFDNVNGLALQSNGDIVAVGVTDQGSTEETALARYTTTGALDSSFGTGGKVIEHLGTASEANAVAIQSDGQIVVAGEENAGSGFNFVLERYNSTNGSLDSTFGTGGVVTTDVGAAADGANALLIQPDGKLVAAGFSGNDFALARYFGSDASADLAVTDSVNNAAPNAGALIQYTLTVTNNGTSAATEVELTDLAPTGVTFLSTSGTGSYDLATGVWDVGNLALNGVATLTITAQVNAGTEGDTIVNTASVTSMGEFDPNLANNTAGATLTVAQSADLGVTDTVNNSTPIANAPITFTITLTNHGSGPATGISVTNLLPTGLTFSSASPSQGSYNSSTGVWTIAGPLADGASVTLLLNATVTAPGPETDTATITAEGQIDPNTANNTANAVVTPQVTDLAVTKTVNDPTPTEGSTVTFTVTVLDDGPLAASGVSLTDLLPAGLSLVSATPSQGTYSSSTGVWSVGGLSASGPGPGSSATLIVVATVNTTVPTTNTATLSAIDQFDSKPANNSASATVSPVMPALADLAVTDTVDNPTPALGGTVQFTVTVTNNGPSNATGVQLTDLLPAGLSFVPPGQTGYSSTSGIWNVGPLASGDTDILVITATVLTAGLQTDTATVTALDQTDPNLTNNTASATITTPAFPAADLDLMAAVDNATPGPGATINITLTLTNDGPGPTHDVTVTDLLPPGLTLTLSNPSEGSYNPTTGVWTVTDLAFPVLADGASATLTLTAVVTTSVPKTDTATVSSSSQSDPELSNNTANVVITPLVADLVVTNMASSSSPTVGGTVTYTITVQDLGPAAGTGVQITDLLPAGLAFSSAAASEGTYNSSTGVWTVGNVNLTGANSSPTLTIIATVESLGTITSTASISAALEFDSNPATTAATATITPVAPDPPPPPPPPPVSPADPSNNADPSSTTAHIGPSSDLIPVLTSTNFIPLSLSGTTFNSASVIQVLVPEGALGTGSGGDQGGSGSRGTDDAGILALLEEQHTLSIDDEADRLKLVSQVFLEVPFALRQLNLTNSSGTILGYCFEDIDGNGLQNGDETPLEGFKVYLDIQHDEKLDARSPVAVTDQYGQFKFEGLAPGTYTIRPAPNRHFRITSPEEGVAHVIITPDRGAIVVFACRPVRPRRSPHRDVTKPVSKRVVPQREENAELRDALSTRAAVREGDGERGPTWMMSFALAFAIVGMPVQPKKRKRKGR